jgi:hypothetical protein
VDAVTCVPRSAEDFETPEVFARFMISTRNGKALEDYLDNAISQLSRESFVKIFVAYLGQHSLNQFVTNEQKEIFFEIANEYMGWQSGIRALPKQWFLQDYDSAEKLMAQTATKCEELQAFFTQKRENSRPTTALLARDIIKEIAVLRNKLDNTFFHYCPAKGRRESVG